MNADGTHARPVVAPALQEWTGGSGTYRLSEDSRVVAVARDATRLLLLARQLTQEIADLTGIRIASPRATTGPARESETLLRFDPGANHRRFLLDWEAAAGRDYDVQVSEDGTHWRSVVERRGRRSAGQDAAEIEPVAARFVRLLGLARQTRYGYSLWRFEVRG
ncbi:discoidin domain-containing protein [Streptomyces sp. H27-C3]|uniref:discoidin domain-containing protein n=1 Tax=Streptomyces sp. H27-C3 TaxID=3046305 RepID=UPI0024BAE2AC|nr:discoidin domain-containing protein [Streptomyces sp. H27-C3]MDJ0464490.1 discoidin domain-containing protein [Streptomyces sp. H27-C3]